MKKYIAPSYEMEKIQASDIIMASSEIESVGEGSLGNITGDKGVFSSYFNDLI